MGVHFGAGVSDDFNRVFVRTDRTVGAQTVEHGFVRAFFFKRPRSVVRKAFAQNVVVDADDKVVLFFAVEIFEYAFYHGGRKFFRAQTVAAADDGIDFASEFGKSGLYVFIQGFAQRTGFFCAVEHGQSLNGSRNRFYKSGGVEGAIQPDFEHAGFGAFCVQRFNRFFNRFGTGAH